MVNKVHSDLSNMPEELGWIITLEAVRTLQISLTKEGIPHARVIKNKNKNKNFYFNIQ